MSWCALLGIKAIQIVGAASILEIEDILHLQSLMSLIALLCLLSLLLLKHVSWLFRALPFSNIGVSIYALWKIDHAVVYAQVVWNLMSAVQQIPLLRCKNITLNNE